LYANVTIAAVAIDLAVGSTDYDIGTDRLPTCSQFAVAVCVIPETLRAACAAVIVRIRTGHGSIREMSVRCYPSFHV